MHSHPPVLHDCGRLLHGGDYNPDQWIERYPEVLEEDLRLMRKAGVNVVSVGIFSWTQYEPREGEFTFEWMDGLLDQLHENGIRAFLATPSGGKPAWMSRAYPEILRMREDGQREHHHSRHNHCPTSPVYREKVAAMNRRLAERYGKHPAVALWHVSNEYNGECHCPLCHAAFQQWLKDRYGSLEELNHAWWARFWSHRFSAWEEIDPRDVSMDGMRLDWMRFVTHQTVDFYKAEVAALRESGARQPATTNMMGTFPQIDFARFAEVVDVIADDSYPNWRYEDEADRGTAARIAFTHDLHRAMKGGKPWLLMESCPDSPQWCEVPRRKRPGVYRTEMLQALAHGSDAVMYFQWRKGRGGMEKFHDAVVDHEGSENTRVFGNVAKMGETLKKLQPLVGTGTPAEAAVIFDWEVRWAFDTSKGGHTRVGEDPYVEEAATLHRVLWSRGLPVDVIESTAPLDKYRLLIAPQLFMLKPGVAEALQRFVENGGTLLLTPLSGVVDETNLCFRGGFPGGGLRAFTGVWAEEVDYLFPENKQFLRVDPDSPLPFEGSFATGRVVERLHAEEAEVLATFREDYLHGAPALCRRRHGEGGVYYLGARMPEDFLQPFLAHLTRELRLRHALEVNLPRGVSATFRTNGAEDFVFLQNFSRKSHVLELGRDALACLESGEAVGPELSLRGWETRVLRRDKAAK